MLNWIHAEIITGANLLILVGVNVFTELLGTNGSKHENKNKISWWKRQIQTRIAELKRHVAQLQEWNRGKLSKNRVEVGLERKYYVNNKGLNVVVKEIKQRIKAKTTRLQKYDERNNHFVQNRLFQSNQKLLFEKIEVKSRQNDVKPSAEESRKFWSNIWSQNVEHDINAEWISKFKESVSERRKQEDIMIDPVRLRQQLGKLPKWKACGPDKVYGFWIK